MNLLLFPTLNYYFMIFVGRFGDMFYFHPHTNHREMEWIGQNHPTKVTDFCRYDTVECLINCLILLDVLSVSKWTCNSEKDLLIYCLTHQYKIIFLERNFLWVVICILEILFFSIAIKMFLFYQFLCLM